jgi:hypothetical protein
MIAATRARTGFRKTASATAASTSPVSKFTHPHPVI